ncbi:MAG: metallophosphoesterase family protein [Bacteroidetes bacterium]|nr:metallophosphoesterase family protein [Bacteroidota bacterium]
MKIGIVSDTHGHWDERLSFYVAQCQEVWHAGDFGSVEVVRQIEKTTALRGVHGNIDGKEIRSQFPENMIFDCEGMRVLIRHICGYPGRYGNKTLSIISREKPHVVIAGHSHICKVVRDNKWQHLHINPGAAGYHGFHHVRTMITMELDQGKIEKLQVVELGGRAVVSG